jgi:hypothetical protein
VSTVAFPTRARARSGEDVLQRVRTALTVAVLAGAALAALAYLYVALRRIGYPYELEWIEGGSLQHVARVVHGQALYTRPTLAWTPNIYPPLYYWVSAIVAHVAGLGFPALRAVSIVSSLVLGAAVFALVRRETGELVGPAVATGLVYASYRIGGAWLDIARVDSMFLALLVVGLLLARRTRTSRDAMFAAAVMVLAVLTKQSGVVPALAVVPWLISVGRRVAVTYVATFTAGCVVLLGALQLSTHGWFSYYIFTVPSGHSLETSKIIGFFTGDLLGHLAPALVVGVLVLAAMWRERATSRVVWFWFPVFAGLLFTAYSARVHTGGWDNVLLPAYIAIAAVAGIAAGRARASASAASTCVVLGLTALQFVFLAYAPWKQVPPASDVGAGSALIAELRALPEPVLMTGQSWLLEKSGHESDVSAHASAIVDVLRAHAGEPARRLGNELDTNIRRHRYCSVVVDRPAAFSYVPASLERYYKLSRVLLRGDELRPVTGIPIVPWEVWVPRGGVPCG